MHHQAVPGLPVRGLPPDVRDMANPAGKRLENHPRAKTAPAAVRHRKHVFVPKGGLAALGQSRCLRKHIAESRPNLPPQRRVLRQAADFLIQNRIKVAV